MFEHDIDFLLTMEVFQVKYINKFGTICNNTHTLIIPTEALTGIFMSSLYYFADYIIHVHYLWITCLKQI